MKNLKNYPTPVAGLALGTAGVGAFWSSVLSNVALSNAVVIISSMLVLILISPLLLKFTLHFSELKENLKHPTVGSVVPTLAMSLMILSHNLGMLFPEAAIVLWLFAVVLHATFFTIFSFHQLVNFNLSHIVPSWFVPPIGIVVACLTVPSPSLVSIGYVILFFGILAYAILLPLVLYRLCLGEKVEDARKPTLAILAAPASLNLAGYLTLSASPNPLLVLMLFSIAVVMTMSVYLMLSHLLRLPFSPAYSAFTFPLAISAMAMFKMSVWSQHVALFSAYEHVFYIGSILEGMVASIVTLYVLQHYVRFFLRSAQASKLA